MTQRHEDRLGVYDTGLVRQHEIVISHKGLSIPFTVGRHWFLRGDLDLRP